MKIERPARLTAGEVEVSNPQREDRAGIKTAGTAWYRHIELGFMAIHRCVQGPEERGEIRRLSISAGSIPMLIASDSYPPQLTAMQKYRNASTSR